MHNELLKEANDRVSEERDFLESNRAENHKMWDNQMLGLSTVILGVSVSFLGELIDFNTAKYSCLVKSTWVFLAITICLTVSNFMIADIAYAKWYDVLINLRNYNKKIDRYIFKGNSELKDIEKTGDIEGFRVCREKIIKGIGDIDSEYKLKDSRLSKMHLPWNRAVWAINYLKTITFIISIVLLVLYININL